MDMSESLVYGETNLIPFQQRLEELSAIILDDGMKETHPQGLQILLERKLNRCSRSSDFVWVLKDLTHGCMRQPSYCTKLASHCQSSRTSWYLFMQHLFISGGSLLLGGQAQTPKSGFEALTQGLWKLDA